MNKKTRTKTILLLLVVPALLFVQFLEYRFLLPLGLMSTGMLALAGVSEVTEKQMDQVIFLNESSAEIAFVELEQDITSQTYSLNGKDKVTVEWDCWPCELTASDAEGRKVAALTISEDPEEDFDRDQWYVIAQDGPDGVVLTLSYSDNLRKVRKWGEETSGLDLTDGLIRQFIYRHGWMGDGDTLFVMTFTPEQGAELERSMAQTNGWHRFPTHELINRIFFHKGSYCRDLSGKNYLPSVENGWYFFRDMFNVQHGEDDENQWNLDGRAHLPGNFDAGIYDSDTCTLYLFEFDS